MSINIEKIPVVVLTNDEKKDYLKAYRRDYYRKKYHTNIVYNDYKKTYNKSLYKVKTISCLECFKKKKLDELENMKYEYNPDKFICPECLPENKVPQVKCKRGRPKKQPETIKIIIHT